MAGYALIVDGDHGADLDGAVAELSTDGDGVVRAEIRIPAHQQPDSARG